MSADILFVHGAAGDARIWSPVIAALPQGLRGHALTLTYFGPDDWRGNGSDFGTPLHAADIIAAARAIGRTVHLICWSYGVHPGLAALLAEPALFASALFYEAPMPHYIASAEDRHAFAASYAEVFGPVTDALSSGDPPGAVAALVGPAFAALPQERRAIYLGNARMMPLMFGGGQPPARITPRELATIATPCCAAMGSATPPAFALPTRALAREIPGATLEVVAGADHFLPETGPERFAALVAGWIARHSG